MIVIYGLRELVRLEKLCSILLSSFSFANQVKFVVFSLGKINTREVNKNLINSLTVFLTKFERLTLNYNQREHNNNNNNIVKRSFVGKVKSMYSSNH